MFSPVFFSSCEAIVLPINVIQAIKRSLIYSYTGVGSLHGI